MGCNQSQLLAQRTDTEKQEVLDLFKQKLENLSPQRQKYIRQSLSQIRVSQDDLIIEMRTRNKEIEIFLQNNESPSNLNYGLFNKRNNIDMIDVNLNEENFQVNSVKHININENKIDSSKPVVQNYQQSIMNICEFQQEKNQLNRIENNVLFRISLNQNEKNKIDQKYGNINLKLDQQNKVYHTFAQLLNDMTNKDNFNKFGNTFQENKTQKEKHQENTPNNKQTSYLQNMFSFGKNFDQRQEFTENPSKFDMQDMKGDLKKFSAIEQPDQLYDSIVQCVELDSFSYKIEEKKFQDQQILSYINYRNQSITNNDDELSLCQYLYKSQDDLENSQTQIIYDANDQCLIEKFNQEYLKDISLYKGAIKEEESINDSDQTQVYEFKQISSKTTVNLTQNIRNQFNLDFGQLSDNSQQLTDYTKSKREILNYEDSFIKVQKSYENITSKQIHKLTIEQENSQNYQNYHQNQMKQMFTQLNLTDNTQEISYITANEQPNQIQIDCQLKYLQEVKEDQQKQKSQINNSSLSDKNNLTIDQIMKSDQDLTQYQQTIESKFEKTTFELFKNDQITKEEPQVLSQQQSNIESKFQTTTIEPFKNLDIQNQLQNIHPERKLNPLQQFNDYYKKDTQHSSPGKKMQDKENVNKKCFNFEQYIQQNPTLNKKQNQKQSCSSIPLTRYSSHRKTQMSFNQFLMNEDKPEFNHFTSGKKNLKIWSNQFQ